MVIPFSMFICFSKHRFSRESNIQKKKYIYLDRFSGVLHRFFIIKSVFMEIIHIPELNAF